MCRVLHVTTPDNLQPFFLGHGPEVVYLKPQEWGSGAAGDKLEQFPLFFIREPFHDSPEDFDDRMVSRIASCDTMNTF